MAIRGTLTHRKTRRLAKLMNIAQPFALGLMEALWHVTAEQAPTGAIGRLSNKDIADEMFWDEDPDLLIESFISAGLIDKHPQFRLVIHDWQSHADQATKRKLARHGKTFADGDDECLVMTSQSEATTSLPVPESSNQNQEPVPEPVPTAKLKNASTAKREIPTLEQVRQHAKEIGMPQDEADTCFYWYDERDWLRVSNGKQVPITKWKSTVSGWHSRNSSKTKAAGQNGTTKTDWTAEDVDRMENPWKYLDEGQN